MTDYTKVIPSGGTMMIRDTGTYVQFWIKSDNPDHWVEGAHWSWTANGTGASGRYDYPMGAQWQMLGQLVCTYAQTVSFTVGSTVTSLTGSTIFAQAITRGTVPPAPTPVTFDPPSNTSVTTHFASTGDGGHGIDYWELWYSTNPVNSHDLGIHTLGGYNVVTGLTPGTTYYFWARGHNSLGDGVLSTRTQITTLAVPGSTSVVTLSNQTQTTMDATFLGSSDGGAPIIRWEIGYGTDPTTPQHVVTYTAAPTTIVGLDPGTTYYFWSRGVNSVGNSPWSPVSSSRTIAGARVMVDGVWKEAIPYVKVGGVWTLAQPWARIAGVWKETI